MTKKSAGIVLYRDGRGREPGYYDQGDEIEVLLVHPGGPLWAGKDAGAWSVPKGEYGEGEDAFERALREFEEELGSPPRAEGWFELGEVVQKGGKRVRAWAARGEFDTADLTSNTFEIEWPPRSGSRQSFPEVDRAAWFGAEEARLRLVPAQVELLERLLEHVSRHRESPIDPP